MRLELWLALLTLPLAAQQITIRPAPQRTMPGEADSASPGHWWNGAFRLYNSNGYPIRTFGPSQLRTGAARAIRLDSLEHLPMWIESTWVDEATGNVYAWYHHETIPCDTYLGVPEIGALVSTDEGNSFQDLGIILRSGDHADCNAANGYFAGGHGDFTVIPDREGRYFYFLFSNYGGVAESQGVGIARMAIGDRDEPVGRVFKFYNGGWAERGLGGRVTPVLNVRQTWNSPNTDAFWGPNVHWNTHLNQYVMLLNRSCCDPYWPQEGVYLSTTPDLANPNSWTEPQRIFGGDEGWYPQVMGIGEGQTDKLAGRVARFFMGAHSSWEIVFGESQ